MSVPKRSYDSDLYCGYSIEDFKGEYIKFVESLQLSWQGNSGYEQMVWALSIGFC